MVPRSLHLGVIHGGRIIQEREVPLGRTVSVGESPSSTLVVPQTALTGQKRTLFEAAGPKFALSFTRQMAGVVTVGDHEVELTTLRDKGLAKKRGEDFLLPLVDKARGAIELGDCVVVFDFVDVQAPVERLHLPVSVRSDMVGRFDNVLALSLAASSLVFGLLIAWVSSIPVPEEIPFDQIDDRFVQMIMPRAREADKKELLAAPEKAKVEEKKEEKKEDKKVDPDDKEALAARKAEMQKKVAGKGVLAILGTKGVGKGAVADVFSEGRVISGDIDAAFRGISGVEVANGGNTTSRGAGGSGTSTSIGQLGTSGTGKVALAEKTEARVGNVKLTESPEVDGQLDQADIARVVKGRLTAIKECYERELRRNPQLSGKVVVRFTIDEEGRVTQTVIEENTLSDRSVATCVAERVNRFRFPKPDGGSVTVAYPFIFSPST